MVSVGEGEGERSDKFDRRRPRADTKTGGEEEELPSFFFFGSVLKKVRKLRLRRKERCSAGSGGGDSVMVGCCSGLFTWTDVMID